MVPEDFVSFFSVSAGASATLIGLLFIAISIEPGRVFGSEARAEAAAKASSAFTVLANVFFVSLAALITSLRSRHPRIGDERVRVAQHRADGP
jgi:hypothetical protein